MCAVERTLPRGSQAMSRPFERWVGLAVIVGAVGWHKHHVRAQDEARADTPAQRLEGMAKHARSVRVFVHGAPGEKAPIALAENPIVRYDDAPRGIHDATLWAWGPRGRPAALLKVEHYPANPPERRWIYGLVTLAPELIDVEGDGWSWASTKPGLELRALADARAPSDGAGPRLSQM